METHWVIMMNYSSEQLHNALKFNFLYYRPIETRTLFEFSFSIFMILLKINKKFRDKNKNKTKQMTKLEGFKSIQILLRWVFSFKNLLVWCAHEVMRYDYQLSITSWLPNLLGFILRKPIKLFRHSAIFWKVKLISYLDYPWSEELHRGKSNIPRTDDIVI